MVPARVAVDSRRPSHLTPHDDQRLVEQSAVVQVGQQCRQRRIGMRNQCLLVAGEVVDMRVPASVADADKSTSGLDQPAAQQATLAQRSQPVLLAQLGILRIHVERLAGGRRGDQLESLLVVGRHRGRTSAARTPLGQLLDTGKQATTKIEAATAGAGGQVQVTDLKIRLHRVGLDHERRVLGSKEPRSTGTHRLGNTDVGGYGSPVTQFPGDHRADRGVLGVEGCGRGLAIVEGGRVPCQTPVTSGLMAVVAVAVGPQDRELVGDLGTLGQDVADLDAGHIGRNRVE